MWGALSEERMDLLQCTIYLHFTCYYMNVYTKGSAVAQAVSRWLPTVAAWVRLRAEHVGFVVEKAALG
jgi:hypothetical protein